MVEWKPRINGFKPLSSWIPASDLRLSSPGVLCDFLLKHIKIPDSIPTPASQQPQPQA